MMQLFACLTGDYNAAGFTGLIRTGAREDAYTNIINLMNKMLPADKQIGAENGITRKNAKSAIMCYFYGSKAEPIKTFGKGIILSVFYKVMESYMPQANVLYQALIDAWDGTKDQYQWQMPDGHWVVMDVEQKVSAKFNVRSLGGAEFSHTWDKKMCLDFAVKLVANFIHSTDAYVAREMVVRAKMPRGVISRAADILALELHGKSFVDTVCNIPVSVSRINDIDWVLSQPDAYKFKLLEELKRIENKPVYEMQTIHDSFRNSPRYMNLTMENYKHILSEIADSNFQDSVMIQLTGKPLNLKKLNLKDYILDSEYPLS